LVKQWGFTYKNQPTQTYPYQNQFTPNGLGGEASPRSVNNTYAQWAASTKLAIQDLPGEAGQNVANPYSDFQNHKVVVFNQEVFDPSYGKRFKGGLVEWANGSVAGFIDTYKEGPKPYYLFSARQVSDLEKEIKFQ
jgi:hypothetical protein